MHGVCVRCVDPLRRSSSERRGVSPAAARAASVRKMQHGAAGPGPGRSRACRRAHQESTGTIPSTFVTWLGVTFEEPLGICTLLQGLSSSPKMAEKLTTAAAARLCTDGYAVCHALIMPMPVTLHCSCCACMQRNKPLAAFASHAAKPAISRLGCLVITYLAHIQVGPSRYLYIQRYKSSTPHRPITERSRCTSATKQTTKRWSFRPPCEPAAKPECAALCAVRLLLVGAATHQLLQPRRRR